MRIFRVIRTPTSVPQRAGQLLIYGGKDILGFRKGHSWLFALYMHIVCSTSKMMFVVRE